MPQNPFPNSNQGFQKKLKGIQRSRIIGLGEKDPEVTCRQICDNVKGDELGAQNYQTVFAVLLVNTMIEGQ